jgi:mRNA interferase HigB
VRIIKVPFLAEAIKKHPKARKWIESWCTIAKEARWKSIQDVRASYPSADPVRVKSGGSVVVFNVCGSDYRFIAAIHYNRSIVYTLRFVTHAQYSKNKWKDEL